MHIHHPTKKDKKIAIYFLAGITAVFLLLTLYVSLLPTSFIDVEFSEEVQENHNPTLDTIMRAVSWFGRNSVATPMIVVVAAIFFIFKYRKEALCILLTSVASIINYGIKILVNRPRPTDDLVRVVVEARHQSFPSGHTVFYVVFFGFLTFLMYRLKAIPKALRIIAVIFLALIFTVPFSRIYLGDHWFTDVTAGFLLGILFLSGLMYVYLKISRKGTPEHGV